MLREQPIDGVTSRLTLIERATVVRGTETYCLIVREQVLTEYQNHWPAVPIRCRETNARH